MWVFYSLRNYYFHILMNCKIYMLFYESKPTVCWIYLFWMIWVLLNILKLWWCWSMYMICGVRMNCVTVRGGWEFCRLGLHCKMIEIFSMSYKVGTWCIACFMAQLWTRQYESAIWVWDSGIWVWDSISWARGFEDIAYAYIYHVVFVSVVFMIYIYIFLVAWFKGIEL
jgi:hypothetical protein